HKPRSRLRRSRNTNWVTAETSAASQTACGKLMTSPKRTEPRAAINLGLGALHIYHLCFGLSVLSIRAPKCPLAGVKRTGLSALQSLLLNQSGHWRVPSPTRGRPQSARLYLRAFLFR